MLCPWQPFQFYFIIEIRGQCTFTPWTFHICAFWNFLVILVSVPRLKKCSDLGFPYAHKLHDIWRTGNFTKKKKKKKKKTPWPPACMWHKTAIFKNIDGLVLMQLLKTDSVTVNMYKIAPTLIKIGYRIEYLTHFVLFFKIPSCHPGTSSSWNAEEITVHQIGFVQHSQKHNQIS